ncbi:inactive poly [ADP-ribose] polymerase RCD1-like [Phoenix dactylifera]|uniref:Inactive poly [ADP-ribose] polymerase RCD1-like n=1 Tax=Phoenix dactylifera TaxID=42345 RepID=A0A8B8JAZ3_PHODC|nr:inactive poly [ADP-ribose] polymerase RCD1-like [Phoenix dactylifera]XP_008806624.1 inactive poly [ADP-ribose] polymerase RCD1-like [Phoenix dactylifera]XP_026665107.1 inactive poly [ADP-ribose] polymerase RCD1-like [Phoenix dactylifera]XP_026665108.1 inactive poly [ADP-ribose] polymerase RCD1-like [Phoenix dactylifera]XP_038985291.1 inactive poly [ADP-ribose] polymerase RCD1-like [Phoenix dactylifera]
MASPSEPCGSALKRKLAESSGLRDSKIPRVGVEHGPSSRSSVCSCHCCRMQPNLTETCFNYLNSGLPRRVMFYNRGDWSDFPEPVKQSLIEGFRDDKSCVMVMVNGQSLLVDFVSMVLVNLRTRKQCSVAWIDDSDKCFFPSLFFDDMGEEFPELGSGIRNSSFHRPMLARALCPPAEVVKRVVMENAASVSQQPLTAETLRLKIENVERDSESFLFVQNLFLSGMGPFAIPQNILQIHRYAPKDLPTQIRCEAFERQIRSTRVQRGDANVRYGWFGSKKIEIAEILIRGFGMGGKPTEGVLGTGVYLTPDNRAFASVNLCDVDEKGVQCMLLCRAILGNMERVQPGSRQCFPSSRDNDSGVDDCLSPTCHVLWSTHLGSYIHPEYVVSFKLSPNIREYLFGLKDVRFQVAATKVVQDFSSLHPIRCEPTRGPTSPWIPFTVLFAEIQNHVSPLAKELLLRHYEELKSKAITREELVKKMKAIVGEQLLMCTLTRLQRSPSSWYNNSTAQEKPVGPDIPTSEANGSATMTMEPNESCALNMVPTDGVAPNMAPTDAAAVNKENDDFAAPNMEPVDSVNLNVEPNYFAAPDMAPTDFAAVNMETNHFAANMAPASSAVPNMERTNFSAPNMEPDDSASPDRAPPYSAMLNIVGNNFASPNKMATDSAAEKIVATDSASPNMVATDFAASKMLRTDSAAQKRVPNEFASLKVAPNEFASPEIGPNNSNAPRIALPESAAVPNDTAMPCMTPNSSAATIMEPTEIVTPGLEPKDSALPRMGPNDTKTQSIVQTSES